MGEGLAATITKAAGPAPGGTVMAALHILFTVVGSVLVQGRQEFRTEPVIKRNIEGAGGILELAAPHRAGKPFLHQKAVGGELRAFAVVRCAIAKVCGICARRV